MDSILAPETQVGGNIEAFSMEQVRAPSERACREKCAENIWECDKFNEDLIIDAMKSKIKSKKTKREKCAKIEKNKKSKFKNIASFCRQGQEENDFCANQEVCGC